MPKVIGMLPNLDANQKFILGRNLYQASASAFKVVNYFEALGNNLHRYSDDDGTNHILNGILFEIYFDSNGNLREIMKAEDLDSVLSLRKDYRFVKSFEFIRDALSPYADRLLYIPSLKRYFIVRGNISHKRTRTVTKGHKLLFRQSS